MRHPIRQVLAIGDIPLLYITWALSVSWTYPGLSMTPSSLAILLPRFAWPSAQCRAEMDKLKIIGALANSNEHSLLIHCFLCCGLWCGHTVIIVMHTKILPHIHSQLNQLHYTEQASHFMIFRNGGQAERFPCGPCVRNGSFGMQPSRTRILVPYTSNRNTH